jgi:tetratricopeptide (TPR) repeat protein
MMDNDSIDDAEMIITLYADTKMNDECQAIYNLAKARLFYLQDKEIEGDSILNFSIDYYKKKEDKHLLAESYYYKGVLLDEKGNLDAAIANLKEAEIIASNLDDINLTHKIYEMLSSLFLCTNANNLTKEYVCKNLELSKKAKNYNWYLFAACHMANFYSRVGKTDSMYYYYNSMKPYINVIKKDEEKSLALAVLGWGLVKQNQDLAEDYLKQSVAIKPNVNAYTGLADFYRLKDDFEDAQKYALEAYKYSANTIDSLNSANALLSVKKAMGEYKEACDLYEQIDSIKERMNISERDKNSVRIQAQYNVLAKEREFQSTIQNITLVVVIIVVVIIIILFYNHVKMMKMKENQLKDQLLL